MARMDPVKVDFPMLGLHVGVAASAQPKLTTPILLNVRPYDALGNRARGGQRPGLDKWAGGDQIGAAEQPVVALIVVSAVS